MTVSVRNEATSGVALVAHPPTVGLLAQIGVLTVLEVGVGLGWPGWLAGAAYAVATWTLLTRALHRTEVPGWGPADTVTLTRATLVGGVVALVADAAGRWVAPGATLPGSVPGSLVAVLTTLAAVALVLDAVDGQVARRTGTTSALGARFDMETDSVLALVLSVFVAGMLGWWVLAIGLARYAFGAAAWALPWLRAPLPPRWSRKVVAAMQGIVLVVAAASVLPHLLATSVVGLALTALVWSFGRDIAWLAARRSAGFNRLPASVEDPVVAVPVVAVPGAAVAGVAVAGVAAPSVVGSGIAGAGATAASGDAGGAAPGRGRVQSVG